MLREEIKKQAFPFPAKNSAGIGGVLDLPGDRKMGGSTQGEFIVLWAWLRKNGAGLSLPDAMARSHGGMTIVNGSSRVFEASRHIS